jgi:hypothetical protein
MPGPEEQRESEKRLVLAREIGRVRDAIDHTGSGSAASVLEHYPAVRRRSPRSGKTEASRCAKEDRTTISRADLTEGP